LDTEDLHFLREARQKSLKETSKITKLIKLSDKAKRELAAIYRCDLTLMISKVEIELFTKEFNIPERLLYYLPFVYDTSSFLKNNSTGFEDRQHFMSIGNFKHNPNLDMVLELYKSIWPKIRKTLKDAEWHIYGAYLPKQIEQLHQPQHGVIVKGRAEDVLETLAFYRVMLAPLRFGAGLKGKCLDSMRCGTPSVTSSIGAEGIAAGDNWPGFIEDNPQLFAENAIALYKGQDIWISKQQRGFEVLHNSFDVELYSKDFQLELSKGLEQLKTIRQQNVVGELLKHHHQRSTKFMSLWIEEKNR
jgi:glycosyltransferase involved in cell wall biosynthesis